MVARFNQCIIDLGLHVTPALSVVILVRMTLLAKIELKQVSNLSSRDLNCQDNIQLFLKPFEKSGVNGNNN